MRKKYDFSKGKKNPYISNLKKQLSENNGIPYQTLINLDYAALHQGYPSLRYGSLDAAQRNQGLDT